MLADFAYNAGEILRIRNIRSKPYLNECYAVVLNDSHLQVPSRRAAVFVLLTDKLLSFNPESSDAFSPLYYFPKLSIKNANLKRFEWNEPEVLSRDQILINLQQNGPLSRFRAQEITPEQYVVLDRVVEFLWKLCDKEPEVFIQNVIYTARARLVGAWILQNYHFTAMQYVANKNPQMLRSLETAWDGIGVWQA